jgi:RNA polymerase subunit RPABC4/transcription elongation factor Spt4
MAQINCPECNHLMSDQAKICPNCFAPRKVANTKICPRCGNEMEAKKKKCPNCGFLQVINNNNMKNNKQMASKNKSIIFLSLILMLFIGAGIMYFIAPQIIPPKEVEKALTNEYAKVKKINDLYVFIESFPANESSYITLETMEGDNLIDIWNSFGIGKDKFGKVLLNIANAGKNNLIFYEILTKMTEKVHNQYKDASGIIFSDQMKKCQVIKFKNN